jgi:hypothetical protein
VWSVLLEVGVVVFSAAELQSLVTRGRGRGSSNLTPRASSTNTSDPLSAIKTAMRFLGLDLLQPVLSRANQSRLTELAASYSNIFPSSP